MLAYKEQIHAWFEEHAQEMLLSLQELVRIPSVAGEPAPGAPYGREVARALDAALAMADRFGFETKNYDYRIGEARLPGTTGKSAGMIAHLDVVPVGDGWTFPPFEAHVDENGYIVGRGVDDDKEGAVIALYVMRCIRELGLNPEKVNVNGSGISIGHPIGATGAMITIKLMNEMVRRQERYGVATLCIGGGQGLSVLFELCK